MAAATTTTPESSRAHAAHAWSRKAPIAYWVLTLVVALPAIGALIGSWYLRPQSRHLVGTFESDGNEPLIAAAEAM